MVKLLVVKMEIIKQVCVTNTNIKHQDIRAINKLSLHHSFKMDT